MTGIHPLAVLDLIADRARAAAKRAGKNDADIADHVIASSAIAKASLDSVTMVCNFLIELRNDLLAGMDQTHACMIITEFLDERFVHCDGFVQKKDDAN